MIILFKFIIPVLLFNYNLITFDEKELLIELNYNQEKIVLNKSYNNIQLDDFSISKLQFYISNLKFYLNNKEVLEFDKKHILIDIEDESSLKILIPSKLLFDELSFNLGIDEETNKSGAKGGDLDPILGMYWTWNSGYINFKAEGIYNNNNEFLYHIGGFMKPYNALQLNKIDLSSVNKNKLMLNFDEFFNNIDFNLSKILSPGKNAVKLSSLLAKSIN